MLMVEKEMEGRRGMEDRVVGAPRRKLPPLKAYEEPPLKIQYKVHAKAEQVLRVHRVVFRKGGGYIELLTAGKEPKEINEQVKALSKDLGEVEVNYPIFEGTYKEAVQELREKVESVIQISKELLNDLPEVALDNHLCLIADYENLLGFLYKEVKETKEIVDTIYQYLEASK
ncbi:hypothetical protein [Thermovibrio sp.]